MSTENIEWSLTKFQLLLLAIIRDNPTYAYMTAILHFAAEATGKPDLTGAQVYVALKRMQKNGLLTCKPGHSGGGTGNKVQIYSLTATGKAAVIMPSNRDHPQ